MTNKIENKTEVKKINAINNSDILFIYDAKMCNPNGDPDDENKPRMDYETDRNLVSDVRLKRYIRDYLEDKGNPIFVAKVDEKTVDATQRLAYWIYKKILNDPNETKDRQKDAKEIEKTLQQGKTPDAKDIVGLIKTEDELLGAFIDVRLFGATMPIKGQRGESFTFTGPVQFNWGYSLNRVNIVESSTISSTFAGRTREGEGEQFGTFGKDYRVYYSLIAFHGIISGKRAEHTQLTANDISLIQEALIKSIPLQATRSKIGQYPRLLIRVEYTDKETFIGDLRRYIKAEPVNVKENPVRDVSQIKLTMNKLITELIANKQKINKIYYWQDKELIPKFCDLITDSDFKSKLQFIEIEKKEDIAGALKN